MKVIFSSRQLQKKFENHKEAVREWGSVIGTNFIKRITAIQAVDCFDQLPKIPTLKFHPLNSNRSGQFAVNLTGRARLILKHQTEDGNDVAFVVEVDTDHYGL